MGTFWLGRQSLGVARDHRPSLPLLPSTAPEAVKKFRIPRRERSPQRSPLPWGTDFKWLGASTRNGTASVPYEVPIFSQLPSGGRNVETEGPEGEGAKGREGSPDS